MLCVTVSSAKQLLWIKWWHGVIWLGSRDVWISSRQTGQLVRDKFSIHYYKKCLINLKLLNYANIGVIQDSIICKWDIFFLPCDFLLNWLADTYCNHHNERICFGHLFGKYHILCNGTVLCFHHQIIYIPGKNTEKKL